MDNTKYELTNEEKRVVDLVLNSFGEYSEKMLEKITCKETPWIFARDGYVEYEPCNEPILDVTVEIYFREKNKEYDFSTIGGLKKYISDMIK